jgi:hypothetical protein
MRVLLTVVFYSIVFACLISGIAFTQDNIIIPDLSKIESEDGWVIFNRSASLIKEKENVAVSFNSQEGDGIAWLEDIEFGDGIIEIDIKGKDVPGNSFVGVAFHGLDDRTYDAVYFRPFNLKAKTLSVKDVRFNTFPTQSTPGVSSATNIRMNMKILYIPSRIPILFSTRRLSLKNPE